MFRLHYEGGKVSSTLHWETVLSIITSRRHYGLSLPVRVERVS